MFFNRGSNEYVSAKFHECLVIFISTTLYVCNYLFVSLLILILLGSRLEFRIKIEQNLVGTPVGKKVFKKIKYLFQCLSMCPMQTRMSKLHFSLYKKK